MVLTTATLRKRLKLWHMMQILAALLLTGWLLVIWLQLMNKTFEYLNASQQTVARILIEHLAREASPLLQQEPSPQLQQLVDSYASDSNIHDVVIYNALGEPLVQSGAAQPISTLLGLDDSSRTAQTGDTSPGELTPYITTITEHNTPVGYVRMTVNSPKLWQQSNNYLDYGNETLLKLLLGTLTVGFLLTRALSRKRYRWITYARRPLLLANSRSWPGRRWSAKTPTPKQDSPAAITKAQPANGDQS